MGKPGQRLVNRYTDDFELFAHPPLNALSRWRKAVCDGLIVDQAPQLLRRRWSLNCSMPCAPAAPGAHFPSDRGIQAFFHALKIEGLFKMKFDTDAELWGEVISN